MSESGNSSSKRTLFEVIIISSSMMIGAGILSIPYSILPKGIYGTLGWICASVMSIILGISFASICTANGGGDIVSTIKSSSIFGRYSSIVGRYAGLLVWLCMTISCSVILITFIRYLLPLHTSNIVRFGCIVSILIFFNYLHQISEELAFRVIKLFTYIKLLAFMCVSVLGLLSLNPQNVFRSPFKHHHQVENQHIPDNETNKTQKIHSKPLSLIITSAGIAFFAFLGLESNITMANEVSNPKKNIIISMIVSLLIVSVIFILCHLAVVNALNLNESNAHTPTKDAVEKIVYEMHHKNTIFPGKYLLESNYGPQVEPSPSKYIANIAGSITKNSAIAGCIATVLSIIFLSSKLLMSSITNREAIGFQINYAIISSFFVLLMSYLNIFHDVNTVCLSSIPILISYSLLSICGFSIRDYRIKVLSGVSLLICFALLNSCANNL